MSFVAGTLVHTEQGLVPIQDIKVGDMVLSKSVLSQPKDGSGVAEFKTVLSTFKSPHKEKIYKVQYFNDTIGEHNEKGVNYIFCNALHPFWVSKKPITSINANLQGEWLTAKDLPPAYLASAQGNLLWMDDYQFMPVRTLPNFPQGCAYIQTIDHHDEGWNGSSNIEFIKFSDAGYQFVSLATDQAGFESGIKTLNIKTSDAMFEVNSKESFVVDPELYKTLNVRLQQDLDPDSHNIERLKAVMNEPLVVNGRVVMASCIADNDLYEKALHNIATYGNSSGLTEVSLHASMKQYDDDCPNPYEDYVYNIEVADHHTYFVGHDGVWVHE
ncbi:hypothetical protein [Psychrobacter sp. I-STPA6b]|uniref:hypothetical protein n=1 Tax=Psychrobacter sp. I-STPA6b TaxID=2585718 RepID=UPI001D0C1241|nr:hypothetical protein [Psychrobacter sp. I-STPA6b]